MSSTIIIKNSATSGSVPSTLVQGEMAINVTNGRLFYGSGSAGTVKEFTTSASSSISASYALTSSYSFDSVSSSYALTASYALNAGASTAVSASLFVFTQSVAATTWSITHNLNETYPLVNVYSSSYALIPSQIKSIDANSIEIYFAVSSSGYATILGKAVFIEGTVTSASYAATASYVNPLYQNVTISGSIDSITYIDFNTGSAIPAWQSGRIFWNNTEGALSVYNAEADITLQVGQENWTRIFNDTGTIITNGTIVRLNGSQGDVPTIERAQSLLVSGSVNVLNQILGVATHDIGISEFGYITTQGLVRGLNTNAFNDGDTLFVGTGSSGILQNTPPIAPYEIIPVGVCVKASPGGSGIIYVAVQQPIDFADLSSVEVSGSYHYGDIWTYVPSGSTGVWIHTNQLSGSYGLTGSLNATSFTGSLLGTASYASQALTASHASNVLKTKSGVIANTSFTGNPKTATVYFATEFVDDNYAVVITGEDARSWTIESKILGSFIVNTNSNTSLTGNTYWIATAYGEN